jgi:hypothetical protein
MNELNYTIKELDSNLTKKEMEARAKVLVDNFLEAGLIAPGVGMVQLKAMKKIVDDMIKRLEPYAIDDIPNYDGSINGHKVMEKTGGRWDYSTCDVWQDLDRQKKEVEALMKSIKEPVVYAETGEYVTPAIYKPNKTSFSVEFKKD